MRKVCSGTYRAQQVPNAVILFAEGWHATSGYRVWFEQNMLGVFPPEFILYHEDPTGPVLEVLTPFHVHTAFKASQPVRTVIVHDAEGRHEVPVEQVPDRAGVRGDAAPGRAAPGASCGLRGGVTTAITALADGAPVAAGRTGGGGGGGGEVPYPFAGGGGRNEAEGQGRTFEEAFDAAVINLRLGGAAYPDQMTSVEVVSMGALYGGFVGHVGTRRVRVRGH